jgi:hypothetical protein
MTTAVVITVAINTPTTAMAEHCGVGRREAKTKITATTTTNNLPASVMYMLFRSRW